MKCFFSHVTICFPPTMPIESENRGFLIFFHERKRNNLLSAVCEMAKNAIRMRHLERQMLRKAVIRFLSKGCCESTKKRGSG
jgi:hypothetical protein